MSAFRASVVPVENFLSTGPFVSILLILNSSRQTSSQRRPHHVFFSSFYFAETTSLLSRLYVVLVLPRVGDRSEGRVERSSSFLPSVCRLLNQPPKSASRWTGEKHATDRKREGRQGVREDFLSLACPHPSRHEEMGNGSRTARGIFFLTRQRYEDRGKDLFSEPLLL